jgi:CheY-like chemotaxis protein/two-component sensor histidine kinase
MFLSTMSHELRTPMNAVIGMTHLLLASSPAPAQEENLRTLRFSAENLLHIINDILDFSKIEAGKVELEKELFSIQDLLMHIVESFQHKAKSKELQLKLEIDSALKTKCIGDSTRLSQILNNLISNAIKFTYHGSITITASVLSDGEKEQLVRFEVVDTGIGIPENKKKLIFGMFTQANSNTTRKFGGTGLGLTITKRLVELNSSVLNLESTPGHGSRFYFDISFDVDLAKQPQQPEQQRNEQRSDGMQNALKGVKVMVVEDNEVNQILLRKFTQIWGAQMTLAENGLEATQVVASYAPDIILMDLQMPIMDGYAASKIIRKMPEFKDLPILAVTASVLLDVQYRIKEAGMTDYVCKPFKPEELLQKIKTLVFNAS